MYRLSWLLIALTTPSLSAQTATAETILFLRHRQTREGGFTAAPGETKPSLGPTSSAIRALKYFGGEIPDSAACRKFVAACFDKETGGFRQRPGEGKPDVTTTAIGIMAVVELKMPIKDYEQPVLNYLAANARGFEEIRIAAAGLEAIGKLPQPKSREWLETIQRMSNDDGTFGKGDDRPRFTGGAVALILRLGGKLKDEKAVAAAMLAGQRKDGGFAKVDAKSSDLETTYRIVRSCRMIGRLPDNEALRKFIDSCRNDGGGYGTAPGAPSSVAGTYFASILLHWIEAKK